MLYSKQMVGFFRVRFLLGLLTLVYSCFSESADEPLTYLVLADTVEPLMITTAEDPMAGGIVTDVLRKIFLNSGHEIHPLVVPWQRLTIKMDELDNWIVYGMPSQCELGGGCTVSKHSIVNFEQVIVTLEKTQSEISHVEDLFNLRLILVENFHYPGLDQYLTTPTDTTGTGSIREIRAFSPESALRMLKHQRGDAFIDWRVRALYNLPKAGLTRDEVKLSDISSLIPTQGVRFFYSDRLPPEVGTLIDEQLSKMQKDGSLQGIIDAYLPPT
jgi:hypothetical protein